MSYEFLECGCKLDNWFPNGFTSWYETFYEVVDNISLAFDQITLEWDSKRLQHVQDTQGRMGLVELAKELTDKFELKNKDREWNGEFFEEIDEFLEKELYEGRTSQ